MIDVLLRGLESAFAWLLEASWQASVLATLVLLLQWALRARLNPRWYHALWLLVIARLLLPTLPESALSLFQFAPPPPPLVTETITEPIFEPIPAPLPVTSIAPAVPPISPVHSVSAFTILALIWLTGALGLLLLTWQVNRRFVRHIGTAPAVDDPRLLSLANNARRELGVRQRLRIIESAQAQTPAIMGLYRPTLILPKEVRARFTDEEIRFIFLHEFAHLKRGDLFLQWLIAMLQILHWFNPVLWYAFRRMRIDREPATDALVLSRTGEAQKESYGQVLVKLVEHYHTRHSLPSLVGILEDKDQFKRRFILIARFTRGAYGWSLLGVIVIGILAAACLTKAKANSSAILASNIGVSEAPGGDINHQLFDAVSLNDTTKVRKLLDSRADPKAKRPDGSTLLFYASNIPMAQLLLDRGIDIKARDNNGNTALHRMGGWDNLHPAEFVHFLLKHGADPNARNNEGLTPLYSAPDAATVDVLLNAGADIKSISKEGYGVVYGSERSTDRLKELLKRGAPFDLKSDGPTLLVSATHMNRADTINFLLSLGVDPNAEGTWNKEAKMYMRPLQTAVTFGHLDAAKLLVNHGAKITPKVVEGALVNRHKDILRFFWEQGARSISELTYRISQEAPAADIQKLLDAGIPADPPQDKPVTPLVLAAELGQLDVVKLLVLHGAQINYPPANLSHTYDPIDQAAEEGQDEIVAFLLKHGAKPGYQALWNIAWNVNPYDNQRSKDHFEKTLKLLLDADVLNGLTSEEKGRLLDAVIDTRNPGGNATALKMLLAAGLSPDLPMTDEKGKNYGTVLSYYRDLRAKNLQDDFGIFPLIDLLEAADQTAPVPRTTSTSTAPAALNIQFARAAYSDNIATLQKLLDAGADPNTPVKLNPEAEARTPLLYAVLAGRAKALAFLLEHGAKLQPGLYWDATGHAKPSKVDEMIEAEQQGYQGLVKVFWDHGKRSISELSYAITQGASVADVAKMLDAGMPVDPPQDTCAKPLTVAAIYDRVDLVTLLLQRGAKADNGAGHSNALDYPSQNGNDAMVALLLSHGAVPHFSAFSGAGAAFKSWYGSGATVSLDHYEKIMRLLLATGAITNLTDTEKGRILDTTTGHPTLLKMLLDAGLNPELPLIDYQNQNHGTVLSYVRDASAKAPADSALKGSLALLEAAAAKAGNADAPPRSIPATDLNAQLLVAIQKGEVATVQSLLEQGAKASADDVLSVAASKNPQIVQLLRKHNALPISDVAYAILENRPEDEILDMESKELPYRAPDSLVIPSFFHLNAYTLKIGGSVSIIDRPLPFEEADDLSILDDPRLPLPVAALTGDLPALKLLVQRGANPKGLPWADPPNPWLSVSLLSLAALRGHDDVVAYLLQQGVKPRIEDIACAMSLSGRVKRAGGALATSRPQEAYENTVKLLIAAGTLKDISDEQTAFLFESAFNTEQNLGIVKILLDAGLNPNARANDSGKTVIDLTKDQIAKETKYNPEWQAKYHFQRNTKPLLALLEAADKAPPSTSSPVPASPTSTAPVDADSRR